MKRRMETARLPKRLSKRLPKRLSLCRLAIVGLALLLAWRGDAVRAQSADGMQLAHAMQQAMAQAIARAEHAVVAIARVRRPSPAATVNGILRDGILQPDSLTLPEQRPTDPDFVPNEYATGVVVDTAGHVLTNYHVLGDPRQNDYYVWVQRKPFKVVHVETPVRVEAGDPWTDLAILTINTQQGLTPVTFGDATSLRKGMIVIALGNPYAIARDGSASATWGIVANLNRSAPPHVRAQTAEAERDSLHHFGTLIQTDARLQAGTSGGALINLDGAMVGLTTALAPLPGYEQSAGFAIPVNEAFLKTVETLKQGRVPEFGFLGVEPENLSLTERQVGRRGARVLRVLPGTPAAAAELKPDDVIVAVNTTVINDKDALFRELSQLPADSRVALQVERRDPSSGKPRRQTADVLLAKKYTPTTRRPYARVSAPQWRGMQVEYPSALPPQFRALGFAGGDPRGCVAVLSVVRDAPTWRAGLRPGQYISHVERRRVRTPKEFHQTVERLGGTVVLQVITATGDKTTYRVEP